MRSIPARAGEPCLALSEMLSRTVYPRACGGTPREIWPGSNQRGLSPRVRGNRGFGLGDRTSCGSIPARAGEPPNTATRPRRDRVYPRACGGTARQGLGSGGPGGLSPRVRGNRRAPATGDGCTGSIPARAGEPTGSRTLYPLGRVYPRACGGTSFWLRFPQETQGLSPRVRGNRPVL